MNAITESPSLALRSHRRTHTRARHALVAVPALLAVAALTGWAWNVDALKCLVPGLSPMQPNTAVAMLLAAVSLGLWQPGRAPGATLWIGRIAAGAALLLALANLSQHLFGWDLGIDRLLLPETLVAADLPLHPGRMQPVTALTFAFLGGALLLADVRRGYLGQVLALVAAVVALVAVGICLFGNFDTLTGPSVALHSGLGVLMMAVGFLLAAPDRALAPTFRRHAPILGMGATAVMTVFVFVASPLNTSRVHESEGWVRRSYLVELHLKNVDAAVKHGAATVRGFMLTGANEMLANVDETLSGLGHDLAMLEELTAELPEQRKQVAALRQLVARSAELADASIRIRREQGLDAAVAFVRAGSAERVNAEIRARVADMQGIEAALLVRRQGALENAIGASLTASVVVGVMGLALLALMIVFGRRWGTTLEARVAERTRALERSNRALRMLSRCNEALTRATDEASLAQAIAELVVREGGYRFCAVAFAEYDDARTLHWIARAGDGVAQVKYPSTWNKIEGTRTLTGQAIATGAPVVVNDLRTESTLARYRDRVRALGLHSAAALPLPGPERTMGALVISSTGPDTFDDDEMAILGELAKDLAFGIATVRGRANTRALEARYAEVLTGMVEGAQLVDFDWRYVFLNPTAALQARKPSAELIGRTMTACFPGIERTPLFETLETCMTQRTPQRLETEFVFEDGSAGHFQLSVTPVPAGIFILSHDITERVTLLREVTAARAFLDRVVDASPLAIVAHDANARVTQWNPAAAQLFGWSASEVLGALPPMVPPERADDFRAVIAAVLSGRTETLADVPVLLRDGSIRSCSIALGPLRGAGGAIAGAIAIFNDITWCKEAEASLRQANVELEAHRHHLEALVRERSAQLIAKNEQLDAVLNSAPSGIYGLAPDGSISLVNRTALELLGFASLEEVLGRNTHALFHHTRADGTVYAVDECRIYHVLRGGPGIDCDDEVFWRKDGTSFPVEYRVRPMPSGAQTAGCVVTFSDITERRRQSVELKTAWRAADEATRAKSAFLANMSHEIRTPLNAILGFAQLLRRDRALTEEQGRAVRTIMRAGEHLLALISDILDHAKIEAGRIAVEMATVDLDAVLQDFASMYRATAETKGLRLLVERHTETPRYVVTDETKLRQVMQNLIANAVKFTSKGGVAVRMRVAPGGDKEHASMRLVVEVEDSGPGIAPTELPRLFQAFEQAEAGRRSRSGTGLGLAISRKLAVALGGTLEVTSELGTGSTFRLELPVREGTEASLKARLEHRQVVALLPGTEAIRVLVVDDEEENRAFLMALLLSTGFYARAVADGAQALSEFDAWRPQLILMDMRMPIMAGAEAIRRIRPAPGGHAVKIIAVTASAYEEDRNAARQAGADEFLSKPFRTEVLFEKIGALLGIGYVYDQGDAQTTPERDRQCPDASVIARLPPALRERLRQVTLSADLDAMLALIADASTHDAEAASMLRDLASHFAYATILEHLQPARGEPP